MVGNNESQFYDYNKFIAAASIIFKISENVDNIFDHGQKDLQDRAFG